MSNVERLNLAYLAAPIAKFADASVTASGLKWLHTSGQIGLYPDGKPAATFSEQFTIAMQHTLNLLARADMSVRDIVKLTIFMTDRSDLAEARRIRDAMLNGAAVAMTLVFISGLVLPELRVEIECIAAKD